MLGTVFPQLTGLELWPRAWLVQTVQLAALGPLCTLLQCGRWLGLTSSQTCWSHEDESTAQEWPKAHLWKAKPQDKDRVIRPACLPQG